MLAYTQQPQDTFQTMPADQGRERRTRDDLYGTRADTREHDRCRDGQLRLDEPLHGGQAHARCRVANIRVDFAAIGDPNT